MDPTLRFIVVILIGFCAQMIDGTLGMGFGVISSSFLLISGVPPAVASSSVHLSKVLTNGVSGLSHWRFGNVDHYLLRRLLPAGVVGGVLGALLISTMPHGIAKPFVAVYLFLTGLMILWRAFRHQAFQDKPARVGLLGLGAVGGFLDAIGGGGWGPVVTSTLLSRGTHPRLAIGSGNTAEFFVALAIFITFSSRISLADQGEIILGLIIGGVLAAPLAAYMSGRLPARAMMVAVGLLIIILSIGIL
jgi:uncharacterized membrane protein YfcA